MIRFRLFDSSQPDIGTSSMLLRLIFLASVGLTNACERSPTEEELAEAARRVEVQQAVAFLSEKHSANTTWDESLAHGERFRLNPVLTIELEREWIERSPILFVGSVEDISSLDDERYSLKVERGLYTLGSRFFSTEMQLVLAADKGLVDELLDSHPRLFEDSGFRNGVAVIAAIDQVDTMYYADQEGVRQEIKVGVGALLDIEYTGGTFF